MRILGLMFLIALIVGSGFLYFKRQASIPHVRSGSLQLELESEPPLHFFVLGDTGSGDKHQRAVAEAMEKRCYELPKLDGIFLLGDLFYMVGVDGVEDPQWELKIEEPYSLPCLSQAKMYPIFGNHDYRGNTEAFIAYAKKNPRWVMPHRFYSLNAKNLVKFIAIDTNYPDFCLNSESCVVDFTRHELSASARWKIVLAHHPLSTASLKKYQYTGETFLGYLFRYLACDKADLWVSGHAHHLEYRKIPTCKSDLIVSGGGGGQLEDINKEDHSMQFGASSFGFTDLEISQDAVKTRFFNTDLKLLYEHKLQK